MVLHHHFTEVRLNLSRNDKGVPEIFIGIFIDITEQTEQARQLEIETQRHDAIDVTLSQGAAMEEINANIEELSAMAETINQISKGLAE